MHQGIRGHEALGVETVLYLAQWGGRVRMEPFLGFFHQSSKSLVVAARRGHIFATFRRGLSARLTRRSRLVVLGQPPARGVSVAKVLLVLHAPRRPAVKPGTTPVELAAPRARREIGSPS